MGTNAGSVEDLLNAETHLSQWSRRTGLPIRALAIAGGLSIGLLQGLVLDFGIGVGREGPY